MASSVSFSFLGNLMNRCDNDAISRTNSPMIDTAVDFATPNILPISLYDVPLAKHHIAIATLFSIEIDFLK